jgi:hypothetical protein
MADRVSTYRQVRLVLQVPSGSAQRTYFSLHAVGVRKGVPHAAVLADGVVAHLGNQPTTEEIVEALDAAVRQMMLG